MAEQPEPITEGWYLPSASKSGRIPPPRWVLATGNGHVYYSRAGSTHFECSEKTMRRWMKKFKAQLKPPSPTSPAVASEKP